MQTPGPPVQSESGPQGTQVFEDWLQMGVFGVALQSLLEAQMTHVPLTGVPVATFKQTGLAASFVMHAFAPAASHPSQVPVSTLQMGVWGVVQWVSMRQLTHIPFIRVAVAVVTQTGLLASFVAHAPESAHAWQVPVDVLQIGAWGVLQSMFVRQPTHIPAIGPASPGTQTGVPASRLPQAAVFSALQPRQLPASTSQIGVLPLHMGLGQAKAPAAPAAPPTPAVPPLPPMPAVTTQ